jgi:hypothetical protein
MAWCTLSTCLSDYFLMSFQGFYPYRGQGLITYLILTCLAFSYWKAFDSIKPLAWTCLAYCLVMAICFKLFIPLLADGSLDVHSQINYDRMFLPDTARAAFSCEAAPLIMILNPFLGIFGVFPILQTGTRSALAAMSISTVIYLCFTNKFSLKSKKLFLVAGAVVLALVVYTKFGFIQTKMTSIPKFSQLGHGARSAWVRQGLFLSQRLPLTGFGLDSLSNYLTTPKIAGYEGLQRFMPDRTHFLALDIVLQVGWIGFGILLSSFVIAARLVYYNRTKENICCLSVLIAYAVYGCLNPCGCLGESVALTCLFGIRRKI